MDAYDLKIRLYGILAKNIRKIAYLSAFIFLILGAFVYKEYSKYKSSIDSSNLLMDFIEGKNEDFLKKDHKGGYSLVKEFFINSKNPSSSNFEKFSKLDDIIFKNLFYFANNLYFCKRNEYSTYFEADRNPWSSIVRSSNVFCGKEEIIKEKPSYLVYFLIGNGKNVD